MRDFSTKYAVMQSAMSSAERVFELLDTGARSPARRRPHAPARVRGRIEFEHVWFAYKGEDWVLRDVSFTVDAGREGRHRRRHRVGQDDDHQAAQPLLRRAARARAGRRRRRARVGSARAAPPHRRRAAGRVPVHRHGRRTTSRSAGRDRDATMRGRAARRCTPSRFIARAAGRLRRAGARARQQSVRRPAPAARVRARARLRPGHPGARRGDLERRHRDRAADPGRARAR